MREVPPAGTDFSQVKLSLKTPQEINPIVSGATSPETNSRNQKKKYKLTAAPLHQKQIVVIRKKNIS